MTQTAPADARLPRQAPASRRRRAVVLLLPAPIAAAAWLLIYLPTLDYPFI